MVSAGHFFSLGILNDEAWYAMSTSLLSGPGRIAVPALTWTRDLVLRDLRISPSEILHRHDITTNVQTNSANFTKNSRNWVEEDGGGGGENHPGLIILSLGNVIGT